jgi:hypothetical protein
LKEHFKEVNREEKQILKEKMLRIMVMRALQISTWEIE